MPLSPAGTLTSTIVQEPALLLPCFTSVILIYMVTSDSPYSGPNEKINRIYLMINQNIGTSLAVQGLGLSANPMQGEQIWSLVKETRSHMPAAQPKNFFLIFKINHNIIALQQTLPTAFLSAFYPIIILVSFHMTPKLWGEPVMPILWPICWLIDSPCP